MSSAESPPARALVVEDERESAEQMARDLSAAGFEVSLAFDGAAGLAAAQRGAFDVVIVDRMLPGLDGLELVRRLRADGDDAPVLFVTAMGAVVDRVSGLETGGDDYLVKPFASAELAARARALARRRRDGAGRLQLTAGEVTLDRLARVVRVAGAPVDLMPMEFRLLEFLLLHAGQPVTRKMLLEQVWGFRFDPRTNIVETHISRLRTKLEQSGGAAPIRTIRGAGYVVEAA